MPSSAPPRLEQLAELGRGDALVDWEKDAGQDYGQPAIVGDRAILATTSPGLLSTASAAAPASWILQDRVEYFSVDKHYTDLA
eukprot:CAMPEP_0182841854 /NCGR_PEP_ID=MMETSP0006_2-20121128/25283_1 /TAXON_ID=97485 /ORGANISM="Prymnesium parvum, Strain Texoma1" /LENGTH=82 /DNA_ID=CAMNT_0024971421 /DNA_START=240 /DNA_END=486 /DNA_ORIENTATION=-